MTLKQLSSYMKSSIALQRDTRFCQRYIIFIFFFNFYTAQHCLACSNCFDVWNLNFRNLNYIVVGIHGKF